MKKYLSVCLCSLFALLSGCSSNGPIGPSATIAIGGSEGKIYTPEEVNITETLHSFNDKEYLNYQVMPSIGDVDLLVVPVLIPGYSTIDLDSDGIDDKDKVLEDIKTAFFSETSHNINYMSVKEYYYASSYQQLNIGGLVTDWFDLSECGYTSAGEITYAETENILDEVVDFLKIDQNIDLTAYDKDQDGYIDGIWIIYSAPNYTNGGPKLDDNNFWAYTSWVNTMNEGDTESPIANLFGWASYDFMYDTYVGDEDSTRKVDSHTYIHETGHFLGLEDYYGEMGYNPLGGVDMMDGSIIDHNSYSKMLLGWTKPYLVYGGGEIKLNSMGNINSCIVLFDDAATDENGNFNPFGEYILVELYSSDGVNEKDSLAPLSDNNGFYAPSGYGLRIYHVDKRVFVVDASSNEWTISLYNGQNIGEEMGLATPITNSRSKDIYEVFFGLDSTITLCDEIRMIESVGTDTFSSGGHQSLSSLFDVGQEFSLSEYGSQFFHNAKFNNGNSFSKTITMETIYE